MTASPSIPAQVLPRPSRQPSRAAGSSAPSAAVLARMIRRLAARHADQPEVVALCETWRQRVATLERQAKALGSR